MANIQHVCLNLPGWCPWQTSSIHHYILLPSLNRASEFSVLRNYYCFNKALQLQVIETNLSHLEQIRRKFIEAYKAVVKQSSKRMQLGLRHQAPESQQNSVPYLCVFLPACFTFGLCSLAFFASLICLRPCGHSQHPCLLILITASRIVTVSESWHQIPEEETLTVLGSGEPPWSHQP